MKELFGFCNNCWEKYISDPLQGTRLKQENAARIILVEKVIFYEIMGTIEFMLKEHSPASVLNDCQDKRSRIKISCIIEKLHNKNLIEYNDYKIWKCLMTLRNTLIHNGAYAEENTICTAPSFIITFKKEQMCQANLLDFINYIDWILETVHNLYKVVK
jgi:hypothetical protein